MILHIARRPAWERAFCAEGAYRADTLATQGFIHASTGHQWTRPLRALFAGARDLVLLQVDEAALDAEVRYEPGDPGDPDGELFPHMYGPVPAGAVTAAEPIPVELTLGWVPMPFALASLTASSAGRALDGIVEWRERGWTVTTRPDALDRDAAAAFLAGRSYWAQGRSRAEFERIVSHSLPFSLTTPQGGFAGMARVVSDRANVAYMADVFVLPEHRGGGRGKFLVRSVLEHPDLAGVKHWLLATRDAHALYSRYGFEVIDGERWMRRRPGSASPGLGTLVPAP